MKSWATEKIAPRIELRLKEAAKDGRRRFWIWGANHHRLERQLKSPIQSLRGYGTFNILTVLYLVRLDSLNSLSGSGAVSDAKYVLLKIHF